MPIDRAATLRNAEKLLRQGKLEQAIAEYVRVVEDQPHDWNTANILGDLYGRAGQLDKAVEQFVRIADHLSGEGFLPKAAALYKKILKLKPDDEHALLQGAEIAGSQGLLADARTYLYTLGERRRSRGDERGLAQIALRLAALDPGDFPSRLAGARARVVLKDVAGAVGDYKQIAGDLAEKQRVAEAIEALRAAAVLSPDDEEIRERLLAVYLGAGDFARARECAVTAQQLQAIAAGLEAGGQAEEALLARRDAARLAPEDGALAADVARAFVERGDMAAAAEFLTAESAGDDSTLLLSVAEGHLRAGRIDEGLALARRLIGDDPGRRDDVAMVGWDIAEEHADAGYRLVELAAQTAVAQSDWPSAAATLQEFVTRVPNHLPALMHLVEICVDGGLEATMYSAQAQLADAYIEAGAAAEARFIAEDLVAREPWDRANLERFRRALVLMGDPDPDAVIAERLSGQSPFTSTDLTLNQGDLGELGEAPPPEAPDSPEVAPVVRFPVAAPPASRPSAPAMPSQAPPTSLPPAAPEARPFELGANALNLESILADLEAAPPPTMPGRSEDGEVDLSVVLDDIRQGAADPGPAPAPDRDMDEVFTDLRDNPSRRVTLDAAEDKYAQGLALRDAGRIEEAISLLQAASRAPRLRFVTASALGRIYRDRGATPQAIEWFERAAQAPAPTSGEGCELLYDLAEALEATGEAARALAICLELQAEAGEYRDIAARIDRLAKVQARG